MKRILVVLSVVSAIAGFAVADGFVVGGDKVLRVGPGTNLVDRLDAEVDGWAGGLPANVEDHGVPVVFLRYVGEPTSWDLDHRWLGISNDQMVEVFGLTLDEIDSRTMADPNRVYVYETLWGEVPMMILSVGEWEQFDQTELDSLEGQRVVRFMRENYYFGAPVTELVRVYNETYEFVDNARSNFERAQSILDRTVSVGGIILDAYQSDIPHTQALARAMSAGYVNSFESRSLPSFDSLDEGVEYLETFRDQITQMREDVLTVADYLTDEESPVGPAAFMAESEFVPLILAVMYGAQPPTPEDIGAHGFAESLIPWFMSSVETIVTDIDRVNEVLPGVIEEVVHIYTEDHAEAYEGLAPFLGLEMQERIEQGTAKLEGVQKEADRRGIKLR